MCGFAVHSLETEVSRRQSQPVMCVNTRPNESGCLGKMNGSIVWYFSIGKPTILIRISHMQ